LQAECREFESPWLQAQTWLVAQLVRALDCESGGAGSSPVEPNQIIIMEKEIFLPAHMCYRGDEKNKVLERIKQIIDRGNIAVFTNKFNGVVKKVREFNLDEMGDLKAYYSTGNTLYVCPESRGYIITEEHAN
jgi:hypothetical protein